jgi:hypothetical protein
VKDLGIISLILKEKQWLNLSSYLIAQMGLIINLWEECFLDLCKLEDGDALMSSIVLK